MICKILQAVFSWTQIFLKKANRSLEISYKETALFYLYS